MREAFTDAFETLNAKDKDMQIQYSYDRNDNTVWIEW